MSKLRLHVLSCGWLTGPTRFFLEGRPGVLRVPVPAYAIEHPRGIVMFDAGMHPELRSDPHKRIGAVADVFTVEYPQDAEVRLQLAAAGLDAARVRFLVASHLHFDHVGGAGQIANAQLVVQSREWIAARDPETRRRFGFDPRDYDLGHDRILADGEQDLFGDGTVVCVPTFGHTPGHQSLVVQLASGPVVLAADACYLRESLEQLHLPAGSADASRARAALQWLRERRDAGARVFYGHDPEFWQTLRPDQPID